MELAILARHGESEFSARHAVNGDLAVSCPLTDAGEEQARALGRALAGEPIDLCVTSEFERVRRTAELALAGRDVPIEVWPELNDPRAGDFEGGPLEPYRDWAHSNRATAEPPGGGESRVAVAARYAVALRHLLARPERTVLVVFHSLPLAYVLAAARGEAPAARMDLVGYARPYRLTADEVRAAADVAEDWCAAPTW